ncbi:MAG: limonene-1,2-epoxide hydrolase family protein [Myxococcota bacterium]|nr:limonene-1,2-epoxide hydrolase family protein [Myxococcota bacterium]
MSRNVERVLEFIDTWSRNDVDAVMAFFAEDAVYHNIPVEPVRGHDAIRAVIRSFAGMASEIEWITHHAAETAEGVVLTERLDRFKMGARWVELPVMGSFELRDGLIVAWRDYFDLSQFQRQLPDSEGGGGS